MDLDALYQDIILDHYRHPHHAGLREPFGVEVHHVNPVCGDEVTLRLSVTQSASPHISDISYQAEGCSISQAATSMMAELLHGSAVEQALAVHAAFLAFMQGKGHVAPDPEVLGDAVAFMGVTKFPARIKCALLGWMAFKDAALRLTASDCHSDTQPAS